MEDWQLGYMAGMIDAEFHLGIQREVQRKGGATPSYNIRLELSMTDKKVIDFVNSLFPATKSIYVGSKGRRQPYYRIRLVKQEALAFLVKVSPYLQGKRRQAEICVELERLRQQYSPTRRHTGSTKFSRMPVEFHEVADKLFLEFRSLQLNKKPRTHKCLPLPLSTLT